MARDGQHDFDFEFGAWHAPICTIDLKVGGRYEYVWRSDEDGSPFGVQGEFREIAKPARLVHTERMDGAPGEALCTLIFEESADGKTTLSTLMHFSTKEARDMALEGCMTDGMAASYDRLEEYVVRANAGA